MPTIDGERCSLSLVKNLHAIYDSDLVTVEQGDIVTGAGRRYVAGAYRVKIKPHLQLRGGRYVTGKSRVFYGESAWNAAERMASDVDVNAWGCTRG
jgi:hypothetical protein